MKSLLFVNFFFQIYLIVSKKLKYHKVNFDEEDPLISSSWKKVEKNFKQNFSYYQEPVNLYSYVMSSPQDDYHFNYLFFARNNHTKEIKLFDYIAHCLSSSCLDNEFDLTLQDSPTKVVLPINNIRFFNLNLKLRRFFVGKLNEFKLIVKIEIYEKISVNKDIDALLVYIKLINNQDKILIVLKEEDQSNFIFYSFIS